MRLFFILVFSSVIVSAIEPLPDTSRNFVSRYCIDCHDEDMNEGDINLDYSKINWSDKLIQHTWADVYKMVRRGKMPPKKKKKQPTDKERHDFLQWLDHKLSDKVKVGGTPIRRLNRREYGNTIKSLFSIGDFKLPDSFPDEYVNHGFDTNANKLAISPSHIEAYSDTANKVADYLFPPVKDKIKSKSWEINPEDMTISYSSAYIIEDAMRLAASGIRSRTASWPTKFTVPASGQYEVKLSISAKRPPQGHVPELLLKAAIGAKGSERLIRTEKIDAKGKVTRSFKVNLYKGENLIFYYSNSPFRFNSKAYLEKALIEDPRLAAAWHKLGKGVARGGIGWKRLKEQMADPNLDVSGMKKDSPKMKKLLKLVTSNMVSSAETLIYKYFEEGPNIGIHKVNINGPLKLISDSEEKRQQKAQEKFLGKSSEKPSDINLYKVFRLYLSKAFRRPASNEEIKKYTTLVQEEIERGGRFEDGMHLAIRTSLLSPSFLFIESGEGSLDAYELSSRLAYFLTSTGPDYKLRKLAESKEILDGATFEKVVVDMLADNPAKFIEDFTSQWLDTNLLETIMPDRKLVKSFKSTHKTSMVKEVTLTFKEILSQNRPTIDFINPDFIYTDQLVGQEIYQLKNINSKAKGLIKVPVKRNGVRGGLLSMPAVMMATANGVDTQPVLRGVWLLENILGLPTPEPPKDVPALPPDTRGATDPRDKLAKHMANASCSSCHEDIDPLGFVLESFDPIGRWRSHYPTLKKSKKGLKINTSGTLPDGTELRDVSDLKKYLTNKPELFVNCLAKKLMSYATGREMNYHEEKLIGEIVESNISSGQGFKDLLVSLLKSKVFKTR